MIVEGGLIPLIVSVVIVLFAIPVTVWILRDKTDACGNPISNVNKACIHQENGDVE